MHCSYIFCHVFGCSGQTGTGHSRLSSSLHAEVHPGILAGRDAPGVTVPMIVGNCWIWISRKCKFPVVYWIWISCECRFEMDSQRNANKIYAGVCRDQVDHWFRSCLKAPLAFPSPSPCMQCKKEQELLKYLSTSIRRDVSVINKITSKVGPVSFIIATAVVVGSCCSSQTES